MNMLGQILNRNERIRKDPPSIRISMALLVFAIFPSMSLIGEAFSAEHTRVLSFGRSFSRPSQDRFRSGERLAKGRFLVASRLLRDPNFSETVVLLIDHDWDGAMGLVINRPSEVRLSSVFPDIEELREQPDMVYFGGPVARNRIMLLIRSHNQPERSHHVFEDIYISSSQKVLEQVIRDADPSGRFRIYAGYAGWGPGQLEGEVSRGGWFILPGDAETVFNKDTSEIWPELIRQRPELLARRQAPASTPRLLKSSR